MNRRRSFVAVAAVAAVLALTGGTGGFSAAQADRGVSVSVVSDEHAYLGISVEEHASDNGSTFTLLSLEDNFAQDVTVESVEVPDDAPIVVESATMDGPVEVTCVETATMDVTLTIDVRGQGVEVVKYMTVTVTCEESQTTSTTNVTATATMTPATG